MNENQVPRHAAAVVSGEESSVAVHDETSVASDDHLRYGNPTHHADELYGKNMDDEDEAWVYRHLRGGIEEEVAVKTENKQTTKPVKMLKPRNSDAVLSCPCCFNTVCMDCQRHERYENQFRAMFVMNIGVDWDKRYVYSEKSKGLVLYQKATGRPNQVMEEDHANTQQEKELYYSVYCNNCQTEVATLNMTDEVYHFSGCLESA